MIESLATGASGLVLRATVLLVGAVLLSWSFRRGSASTRHILWTVTFIALLGLPVAMLAGVRWDLPVLPGAAEVEASPATPTAARATLVGIGGSDPTTFDLLRDDPIDHGSEVDRGPETAAGSDVGPGNLSWTRTGPILLVVWGLGAGAALFSTLVGGLRLRAQVRRARPVRDARWLGQAAALRRRLGIRGDVELLTSREAATPMTTGWQRPVILLPTAASGWSAERREVVLAHELVHVRRRDALRQILGRLALGIYWFHPFGWLAARLARSSREQACDETVLSLGTRPSEYAIHLLDLSKDLGPAQPALGLPMVQRSQLERRVMAILDPRPRRASRVASAVALIAVVGIGVSAATAHPVPVPVQEAPPEASPVVPVLPATPLEPATLMEPTPPRVVEAPEPLAEPWPEPLSEPWPEPLSGPLSAQDASCRSEGLRGNFSGTIRTREGRTEHSSWHNGDRIIQKYVDDLRLCMRLHGEVVMEDDGLGVRAVGADSWVVLESEEDELHRLVITEGPGGLEQTWTVDGRSAAFGADAQAWRDQMFTVLQGYWEASRLRGQQSSLRGQISSARGHVSSLNGQISSAKGHVSSMNGRISSARGRVSSMNGAISSRRGRISSLRAAARTSSDEATRARLSAEIQEKEEEIRQIEREIELYDVAERVSAIESEIAAYDVAARVTEIEREIVAYDVEGRVRGLEQEIEELDADRRAAAIEERLESEVAALRRLIRGL